MIIALQYAVFAAMAQEQKDAYQECAPALTFGDPGVWQDPAGTQWILISSPDITESMCGQMVYVAESQGLVVPDQATFFSETPEGWAPYTPDDVVPPEE